MIALVSPSGTLLADYTPPSRAAQTWPIYLSIALRDAERISRTKDVHVWIDGEVKTIYRKEPYAASSPVPVLQIASPDFNNQSSLRI